MIDGRSPALEQHQSSIDHGRGLRAAGDGRRRVSDGSGVGQQWLRGRVSDASGAGSAVATGGVSEGGGGGRAGATGWGRGGGGGAGGGQRRPAGWAGS